MSEAHAEEEVRIRLEDAGIGEFHRCEASDVAADQQHRNDGDQTHEQWQRNPPAAVAQESPRSATLPQQGGEEPAEHEEKWHPEAVDARGEPGKRSLCGNPRQRQSRDGGVQPDPQHHGEGPQEVQVVAPGEDFAHDWIIPPDVDR